jgi:hypothetical protein
MAAGRRPGIQSRHSVRTVRTHRSANGWLAGPGSDLDDLTPSDRNTSSTGELRIPIGDHEPGPLKPLPRREVWACSSKVDCGSQGTGPVRPEAPGVRLWDAAAAPLIAG